MSPVDALRREVAELRTQLAAALQQSENQLRAVFEGALDAMAIADDRGRYLTVNPAAAELFGVPRDEMLGRCIGEFAEPGVDFDAVWGAFLSAGVAEGEFVLCRPDGERRTLEFRARANVLPGRHLSVMRDVTAQRRLEETLRQTARMESIGRVAGGLAHDFNNMLTAIQASAEFVRDELPETDPLRDELGEILQATERAAALTRPQALRSEVTAVDDVVGKVTRMLRRILRADVELVVQPGGPGARVLVDAAQLEQVLVNLVLNARDAMPSGGTLAVRVRMVEDGRPCVVVSVSDTGVGMDRETRERLFEPFFTTKGAEGTGLGLTTAYGFAKRSGGHIEVRSAPGEGSTFELFLPSHAPGVA